MTSIVQLGRRRHQEMRFEANTGGKQEIRLDHTAANSTICGISEARQRCLYRTTKCVCRNT